MKGVMGFLEKAGLVRMDTSHDDAASPAPPAPVPAEEPGVAPPPEATMPTIGTPLKLDDIYAQAGVPPSLYPAERLLRLIEGLSAMDPGTRLMAIQAMDAADESWTIEDPLADAQTKAQALSMHAELLQLNLQALERDTLARIETVTAKRDKVVGDIRQQMSELDALMNREVARAAQDIARQEAQLQAAREHTAGQLASLSQLGQQLQNLSAQFGAPVAPKE
ncbi:methyl-accepting chemotaxis protein [Hydrogenophaga sp. A37]|uniref:chemotaxis protein n=1 Tax=Hydrogenophaga sp. A37 TaxID=1945864 RepID=UPI0009860AE4|nr:chemotaxis protein [Hydrogenophaga sp. A37]OOG87866.1 chemotaxis protein [Hydrogenophaga sp. A37]